MRKIELRGLELPSRIREAVMSLQNSIEVAETVQGISMASQRAEGFVWGLETASALKPDVVENLYICFESTAQRRLQYLRPRL